MPDTTQDENELQYQKIVKICRKSQAVLDKRTQEIGVKEALLETEPYETMWSPYAKEIEKPVVFRNRNFSGLLFNRADFTGFSFINCDFSQSRWIFAHIRKGDCSGSNFTGINMLIWPFIKSNCTNCNFSNSDIKGFLFSESSIYANADFTNAKMNTSHSYFTEKESPRRNTFKDAKMNGFEMIISKETLPQHNTNIKEIQSKLEQLFSPEQLAVMHVVYSDASGKEEHKSGFFIATAACGIDSSEVMTLRYFRDTMLLKSAPGPPVCAHLLPGVPAVSFNYRRHTQSQKHGAEYACPPLGKISWPHQPALYHNRPQMKSIY